jgi:hypothetical protein
MTGRKIFSCCPTGWKFTNVILVDHIKPLASVSFVILSAGIPPLNDEGMLLLPQFRGLQRQYRSSSQCLENSCH